MKECTPPPEWHLTAQTQQRRAAAHIVAVLGIGRAGEFPDMTDVKEASDEKIVSIQFRHAGRAVKVSFDLTAPSVAVG